MKTADIRRRFLDFFRGQNHVVKDSASLIPHDDPTLLFTSAGMAPFKPYFLGLKTDIKRAASCQKCFRTTDIDNVGYTARHNTFFEMLGNFSFGDYFKKEAIAWAWEFITRDLGLDARRLHVSVHHSDDEALQIWHRDIGVPLDHLVKLGDKDNFWTIGIGPSGPCSEIYIDQGPEIGCGQAGCAPGCDCPRYLEFWNLVFTQFNRAEDGTLTPLEKRNIDTGMGLERLAAIMQGKLDNYDNDIFSLIMSRVESTTGHHREESPRIRTALKVIADHLRGLTFAITDGGMPGNEGRGYVLRKILRRASRFGFSYLGQEKPFLHDLVGTVVEAMNVYPEVVENRDHVRRVVLAEEERFLQTLRTGTEILAGLLANLRRVGTTVLPGEKAFLLHDTYGFPLDLTREICREDQITVDEPGFQAELEKQRERGRANVVAAFVNFDAINPADYPATVFTGYESLTDEGKVLAVAPNGDEWVVVTDRTPFYAESGGQVGDAGTISSRSGAVFRVRTTEKRDPVFLHIGIWDGGSHFGKDEHVTLAVAESPRRATMRNHTATHLLHKALRNHLGTHVKQAGSLVDPGRLRFDFTHFEGMTPETLQAIEAEVNARILAGLPVKAEELSYDEAVRRGAMALFGEKYGDVVRMIKVGEYSCELCGGTHLRNAAEIGLFSIVAESSIAAGVRRIEAVTGEAALERLHELRVEERELARLLDCEPKSIVTKTQRVLHDLRDLRKEVESLRKSQARGRLDELRQSAIGIGSAQVIIARTEGLSVDEMKELTDELVANRDQTVVLLATGGEKAGFVLKVSKDLVGKGVNAGKMIKDIAKVAGGGGGGRPDMATAGGKEPEKVDAALAAARQVLTAALPAQG
jgi:alanyl-tRNA synthetase